MGLKAPHIYIISLYPSFPKLAELFNDYNYLYETSSRNMIQYDIGFSRKKMEVFMYRNVIDYSKLTKEELLNKVNEFSAILYGNTNEDAQMKLIETPWSGSLGEWQWNYKTNKVICNRKKINAIGYSLSEIPEEIGFEFFTDKLHPDDVENVMDNMKRHLLGESPAYEVEYRIQTKEGNYIWFYDRGTVVQYDDDGKPALIAGIVFDITKKKKLEERNNLLAKLPYANPDAVLVLDLSANPIYINPAAQKIIKKNIDEILPPNFIVELHKAYEHNSGTIFNYQIFDKSYIIKIKPFIGEDRCMVTISDISEIVKIEKEKTLYYEALRAIQQPIFISDANGRIVRVNKEFEKLYGFREEELIGENPRILTVGKETYKSLGYTEQYYNELFKDMWQTILDPSKSAWEGDVINRSKSGKVLWIRLSTTAIYNSENELTNFVTLSIDMTNTIYDTNSSKRELYKAISELAELRDNETGYHMRRVGICSRLVAKKMNYPEKFCSDLEMFAPMHDLGKVGIPDAILLAPRQLTKEEFEIMKQHTLFGFNIVKNNKDMKIVSDIAIGHHEKYDGSGYPYGLKGHEIPIAARIVAITDVYDALRSKRPYKKPWSHEDAKRYITENRGKHFDPEIVDVFLELEQQFMMVFDELSD